MLINQSYEEKELLLRVAEGEEKAFAILVKKYGGLLHTFLLKITRDSYAADELVQDTFLRIWLTREGLRFVNSFKPYLFTISRNLAINLLKKTVKSQMHHHQWLAEIPSDFEDQSDGNHEEWKWKVFDVAIENLPPQQKKVWIMARHERKKYQEIASEMHLTRETVKKYLQFAAVSIFKYIEKHPEQCLLLVCFFYIIKGH